MDGGFQLCVLVCIMGVLPSLNERLDSMMLRHIVWHLGLLYHEVGCMSHLLPAQRDMRSVNRLHNTTRSTLLDDILTEAVDGL